MARFDDYLSFDPGQFEPGGGLYGRLTSMLAEQSSYQPVQGSPYPPVGPAVAQSVSSWPRDDGQTLNMRIGDYWMPQFGRAEPSSPVVEPTFGDRLNAGFQSWAHTPLGNPFAAIANGVAGFNSGQTALAQSSQATATTPEDQSMLPSGIAPLRRPASTPWRRKGYYNGR